MALSLQKGQRISLEKQDGKKLQRVCVGLNWGAIQKKGFFGGTKTEAVDLDASCGLFDAANKLVDVVYFGNLRSKDGSIVHSGDDLTGDTGGDDGLDNEIITLDLSRIDPITNQIVFILNSFRGHDFGDIPHAMLRIYEGTPDRVESVFATYNIAQDPKFKGFVSMIMGKLYRHQSSWKFAAIGEPTRDRKLEECLVTVSSKFL
ncbi:MAG: tellurium resistance TerZ family protein [Magnetococcales bacterium]|nr:tellurium resistance TerZ family protein [Magnetococcales bacterium]